MTVTRAQTIHRFPISLAFLESSKHCDGGRKLRQKIPTTYSPHKMNLPGVTTRRTAWDKRTLTAPLTIAPTHHITQNGFLATPPLVPNLRSDAPPKPPSSRGPLRPKHFIRHRRTSCHLVTCLRIDFE